MTHVFFCESAIDFDKHIFGAEHCKLFIENKRNIFILDALYVVSVRSNVSTEIETVISKDHNKNVKHADGIFK